MRVRSSRSASLTWCPTEFRVSGRAFPATAAIVAAAEAETQRRPEASGRIPALDQALAAVEA